MTNKSNATVVGSAVYNVTPDVVGEYFDKIACFCFSDQTLGPHESMDMPVVFFLNPALEEDETMRAIDTVTLSYTFYAPKGAGRPVADAATPQALSFDQDAPHGLTAAKERRIAACHFTRHDRRDDAPGDKTLGRDET